MKKIVLLSDTHGYFDDKILHYIQPADEVWHAGDIGNLDIIEKISSIKKLRAVYGNIDDHKIRIEIPETQFFEMELFRILVIHIAGKFGSYTPQVRSLIKEYTPDILVCGHSHILKIANDPKNNLLYINPGAAGISGFHTVRTLLRFDLDNHEIKNMSVVEMAKK